MHHLRETRLNRQQVDRYKRGTENFKWRRLHAKRAKFCDNSSYVKEMPLVQNWRITDIIVVQNESEAAMKA